MSLKISELPAVTTLDPTDVFPVNKAGVTSKIPLSSLLPLIGAQPLNDNLTIYAGITPSAVGQNILAQAVPTGTSYTNISHLGIWSYLTALQVVADLVANGAAVDTATAQYLANKIIGGIQFAAGTSGDSVGAVTDIDNPSDTYLLRLIKVGYTGGLLNFRFTASTDVTFPPKGVLATIGKIQPTSDATKASASTLNLDATDGGQIDVTGTTGITAITLAENVTKAVVFTGILTITNGASLLLPGGTDKTTAAGDYAIFKGGAAGVVTCIEYVKAGAKIHYGGDFSTGGTFYTAGTFEAANGFQTTGAFFTGGDVEINRPLTLIGSVGGSLTLRIGASTVDVTLPTTGTLMSQVAAPASAGAAGIAGQFAYDATHFYTCIATNTWVRCTLATW